MAHGLFDLLHQEHQRVEQALNKLDQVPFGDTGSRKQLFETLKITLLPHIRAEEGAFYQRLMELPETNDDGVDGVEQHHQIEQKIKELEAMPFNSPVWSSRFQETVGLIQRHVKTEENKVFPDTERIFTLDEINEVYGKFRESEDKARNAMAAGIVR